MTEYDRDQALHCTEESLFDFVMGAIETLVSLVLVVALFALFGTWVYAQWIV